MINGNSVVVQFGKETDYAVQATATEQVKISSESFKATYNKTDEGLATGGRGQGLQATMGIGVEGAFSTLMRPDFGSILKGALGVESVSGNTHTFTCIESAEDKHLPAWTFVVDRKVGKFAYTGCKIGSISLGAQAGNYVTLDVNVNGKMEVENASLVSSLTPSARKAFKFSQGKVYTKSGSSYEEIADVTSFTLEVNNNLDAQTQTTSTGDYYAQPEVGTREISLSTEMIYSSAAEALRKNFYKSDATLGVKLEFTSDETFGDDNTPYSMTVYLPCVQCSDATANMGGLETLTQSMNFNVVDNLTDELISIELVNDNTEEY